MTHFATLQVARDADAETLRETYYDLARIHHPDAGGDVTDFAAIAEAYAVLSDRKARSKYEKQLALSMIECPECDGNGRIPTKLRRITKQCPKCKGAAFVNKTNKRTKK